MKLKIALAGLLVASYVLPAAAETDFYIMQDPHTKKCSIVTSRPTASEGMIVGPDGVIYHTRIEAENALKTVKVCTE